jgi:hypothetical protein
VIIEDKNLKIKCQFYFQVPQTEMEWKEVARCFWLKWNFNDGIGAIDGKHIAVQKPRLSGLLYCNYKGSYSDVLMAAVSALYEFIVVDAAVNCCISDGGVLNHTEFWRLYESHQLDIPEPTNLLRTQGTFPYVLVTDEALALAPNFMRPYSQNALNNRKRALHYRLSRTRRVVEKTFGILVSTFEILRKEINLQPRNVNTIALESCYLHNYIIKHNREQYTRDMLDIEDLATGDILRGPQRSNIDFLELQRGRYLNSTANAKQVRNKCRDYFNNEGKIPWQDDLLNVY